MSFWKKLFGGSDPKPSADRLDRQVNETIERHKEQRRELLHQSYDLSDEDIDKLEAAGFHYKDNGSAIAHYTGFDEYEFEIVGESYYQDELEQIAGPKTDESANFPCIALLICENDNPYDHKAVAIFIHDLKIGHLSRDDARNWRKRLAEDWHEEASVTVDALIVGGWKRKNGDEGSYGVKLDIDEFYEDDDDY